MADKNQQWDELDYSDDNSEEYEQDDYSDEDTSDADEYEDEQSEDYEEDYEDEEDGEDGGDSRKNKKGGFSKLLIALLLLLLLGGGAFFFMKSMSGNNDVASSEITTEQTTTDDIQAQNGEDFFSNNGEESQDSVDISFSENGDTNLNDEQNPDTTVTVNDAPAGSDNDLFINSALEKNQENDSIMVSYNKAARLNPFKPPIVTALEKAAKPYAVVDNTQFEIIEPPVSSTPDENLTRLLQTQISGIMYDPVSPSAIINFNGTDYFVKTGDKVSGYVIKNITRDKVQVNYKNNTYIASVGQLFTRGVLDQHNVADLQHKFAGRYRNNEK